MRKSKRKINKFIKIDHSKSDKDKCRGASASVLYILESDFHKACIDIETNNLQDSIVPRLDEIRGRRFPNALVELIDQESRYIKSFEDAAEKAFPSFYKDAEYRNIPEIESTPKDIIHRLSRIPVSSNIIKISNHYRAFVPLETPDIKVPPFMELIKAIKSKT